MTSDLTQHLFQAIIGLAVPLLPVFIVIYLLKAWLHSPKTKGAIGEKLTSRQLRRKLDPAFYTVHDDVYLPRPDGRGTIQIDHVVVSPFGVFVIETKNLKGWIFGDEESRQWTQTLYRKKFRFQNPIHQNQLHVNSLAKHLQIHKAKLENVVFFVGDATFKKTPPPFVLNSGLPKYIESHQSQHLSAAECERIRMDLTALDHGKRRKKVSKEHLAGIRMRRAGEHLGVMPHPQKPVREISETPPPLPSKADSSANELEVAESKTLELFGRNLMLIQHLDFGFLSSRCCSAIALLRRR